MNADTIFFGYIEQLFFKYLRFGILFLLVQGVSEILKSYWASTKGKWPGDEE